MEKIHSAIQKARRERDEKLARLPAAPGLVAASPVALPSGNAPAPHEAGATPALPETGSAPLAAETLSQDTTEAEVAAAWAALPQYRPDHSAMQRHRLVAFESGADSACYDVLRTNILRQMRANGWKRLAITSPTPGCGKTTTSLNLGFSLGRLHDLRAMIIEADLRRPAMRHCLHLKHKHMFADVFAGKARAADNLIAYGKGLAFGTNHGPTRNSAELLGSPGIAERLDELDRLYAADITIFDMTPMLVSDDTIAFLPNVDCALLISAAGVTTTAQVDRCERALAAQTNVLGVVLNKCQFMGPDENYGYDYY